MAESRLRRLEDGRYEYLPKKGVTFVVTAEQLVRQLVSLVLRRRTSPASTASTPRTRPFARW